MDRQLRYNLGLLSVLYNVRATCVKSKFVDFQSVKESVRNICLHAIDAYFCYQLCTNRLISDTEAIVIRCMEYLYITA